MLADPETLVKFQFNETRYDLGNLWKTRPVCAKMNL
jgi:hypothetical protein